MQLNEQLKFNNTIRITLRDLTGNVVKQITQKNLVTTIGKRLMLDILGQNGTTGILYGAVGTGDTAAVVGDTTLETEFARNLDVYSRSQSIGTFSVFFNTGEANTTIKEIGFFGGSATGVADSGTLFNRIVLTTPITKAADYTLSIDLDISIS